MSLPTLLTSRLKLEAPDVDKASQLARAVDDALIQDFTTSWLYPMSLEQAQARIEKSIKANAVGQAVSFAIVERKREIIVGWIGCSLEASEVGYWISASARGQGYAWEALEALLSYLFEIRAVASLQMGAEPANLPSLHLIQKAGFEAEGCRSVAAINKDGAQMTCNRFVQSREAYMARKQASGCFGAAQVSLDKPVILVSAAVMIDRDGRILLAQRPEGKSMAGLWEFPGGKVENGESPEVALVRELREELGIDVTTSCLAPLTFASHAYEKFHLLMPLFAIRQWRGRPDSCENQALAWVPLNKLRDYPMPPADVPLIPILFDLLA